MNQELPHRGKEEKIFGLSEGRHCRAKQNIDVIR